MNVVVVKLPYFLAKLVNIAFSWSIVSLLLPCEYCHAQPCPAAPAPADPNFNFKQGLSIKQAHTCETFNQHTTSSWWYSWMADDTGFDDSFCADPVGTAYNLRCNTGREFVPMFWGPGKLPVVANPSEISSLYPKMHDNLNQAKYLMSFNEPNLSSQSDMTELEAAQLWPQIESIATYYNLQIIAPCLTQGKDGRSWLDAFLNECQALRPGTGCRFEYICVHLYYEPDPCDAGVRGSLCIGDNVLDTANKATRTLDDLYVRYGKKIWVTEFGCADWSGDPNQCDESDHAGIIAQVKGYLDKNANIFRYAFFTAYDNSVKADVGLNKLHWNKVPTSADPSLNGMCAYADASGTLQINHQWIAGAGNTWAQCVAKARANSACYQDRLTISKTNNNGCYCGKDACDIRMPAWGGLVTFQQVQPEPAADELTNVGILYNTPYTLWSQFVNWWNGAFYWLNWGN